MPRVRTIYLDLEGDSARPYPSAPAEPESRVLRPEAEKLFAHPHFLCTVHSQGSERGVSDNRARNSVFVKTSIRIMRRRRASAEAGCRREEDRAANKKDEIKFEGQAGGQ